MKTLLLPLFLFFVPLLSFSQDINYIRGKIIYQLENNIEEEQRGINVLIEETGDRDKTDNNGIFRIYLKRGFNPGDRITVNIEKDGWAIRDPIFGQIHIPSNPDKELLKINILPKGSPLFFTDKQISRYIEYLILKNSKKYQMPQTDYSSLTLESLLDTMAFHWGFKISEIQTSVEDWIYKSLYDTINFYEGGLAEYANKNFNSAGELFNQSARVKIQHYSLIDEDFKEISLQRKSIINEVIRDLRLAGESYFEIKNYDSVLVVYKSILPFLEEAQDWETIASTLNKIAICYYYLSFRSYNRNKFIFLDSAKTYLNQGLELSNKFSLEEWKWKFSGNLATIVVEQEVFTENEGKAGQLLWAIRELELVESARQNKSNSIDNILSRNNIGVCYGLLYDFTENKTTSKQYLDSALLSYSNILKDSVVKIQYPLEWSSINYNFALSSIIVGRVEFSIPYYSQRLINKIYNSDRDSFILTNSNIQDLAFSEILILAHQGLIEAERIISQEQKSFELVSVLNSLAMIRLQLMVSSPDYLNNEFINDTDSIILKARALAIDDNHFREIINATSNLASLKIIKWLYYKEDIYNDIIQSNLDIDSLLSRSDILKLYETTLKRTKAMNLILLAELVDDHKQKNTYLVQASELFDSVLNNYRVLYYYRDFEEVQQIRKIIFNSN